MKTELITSCCIGVKSTLSDAIFAMSAGRVGACFILENGFLKALFTDGDLRRFLGSGISFDLNQNLLEIATREFTTVGEDELVIPFLKRMEMQHKKFSVFPVVNEQQQFMGVADLHQILALEL
jgi:CBS domain-containing protein